MKLAYAQQPLHHESTHQQPLGTISQRLEDFSIKPYVRVKYGMDDQALPVGVEINEPTDADALARGLAAVAQQDLQAPYMGIKGETRIGSAVNAMTILQQLLQSRAEAGGDHFSLIVRGGQGARMLVRAFALAGDADALDKASKVKPTVPEPYAGIVSQRTLDDLLLTLDRKNPFKEGLLVNDPRQFVQGRTGPEDQASHEWTSYWKHFPDESIGHLRGIDYPLRDSLPLRTSADWLEVSTTNTWDHEKRRVLDTRSSELLGEAPYVNIDFLQVAKEPAKPILPENMDTDPTLPVNGIEYPEA